MEAVESVWELKLLNFVLERKEALEISTFFCPGCPTVEIESPNNLLFDVKGSIDRLQGFEEYEW